LSQYATFWDLGIGAEMPVLTKDEKKAVTALNRPVSVSCQERAKETEILVERFCRMVEQGRASPDEVLILTPTERTAREIRNGIARRLGRDQAVESAHVTTIHRFCSRVLHENAFEARIDPRFSVLTDARQRIVANRALDEAIEARRKELGAAELIAELGAEVIGEAVISICRHVRSLGCEPSELMPRVNDPRPFLETFERCYRELAASAETADYFLEKVMFHAQREMPKALESAERLACAADGFDWKDFQRVTRYRRRFTARRASRPIRQQIEAAGNALGNFLAACLDRPSSHRAGLLLDLAADFGTRYALAKERAGLLDYDDLLGKTTELLCSADRRPTEIACRYRDKFKYVMLADSQDASSIQRQILDAISQQHNVFTIGREQSAASLMRPDARVPREQAWSRRTLSITLQEGFCGRRGIAGFINWFFGKVWAEDSDVGHEDLKCAGSFGAKSEPDVEVILVPKVYKISPEGVYADCGRLNEALAIAHRILEITGGSPLFHTKEGRAGQRIGLRDIVILLRSMADAHIYERALEEHGIGVRVIGDRPFSSAPEVQDVLRLLQAVDNPADDIPNLDEPDRSRLSGIRGSIRELLDTRPEVGVAHILDIALAKSGFETRLLAMQDGRRRYANIRRLCEIAQEFRAHSLPDFVAHIQELERLAAHQMETAADEDIVRITTIRRARELRSPVVFVADMSRHLHPRHGPFVLDGDWGMAVQVRNPRTGEIETPLSHREISERVEDRVMSEAKRLLYLAMTRAEEHLILVGSSDLRGDFRSTYRETGSWTGWLENTLDLGPGTPEGELIAGRSRLMFRYSPPDRTQIPPLSDSPTLAERFAAELQEGRPIEGFGIPAEALETAANVLARCLAVERPVYPGVSRLSVSQILDYLECPARYRLIHIIGLPQEGTEPPEEAEETEYAAADLGHLVHRLLASVDFSHDAEPQIQALMAESAGEPLGAHAAPLLERFAASRCCRDLRSADRVLKETPFELAIDGKVLAGRMDVIYHGADGWNILDYKTGRGESRERYELQVGIYACAASRLIGEMPVRAGLILLSAGEEWARDTSDGSAARLALGKITEVAAAIEAGRFDPKPGKVCEWCSFAAHCGKD